MQYTISVPEKLQKKEHVTNKLRKICLQMMCSEGHTSNSPRSKLPLTPGISKIRNVFVQWVIAMLLITQPWN